MSAPAWLGELQAGFGRLVHSRLDRSRGRIEATPGAYDRAIVGAVREGGPLTPSDRLAVYNRQYWFRLFAVFDGDFPLTARVRGHWSFNADVEDFLEAHPPRSADIHEVGDGFASFMRARFGDASELGEAIGVDAAWRTAAHAPPPVAWQPALAGDAIASLLDARFLMQPGATLLRLRRDWIGARRALVAASAESAPFRAPPLEATEAWLVTAATGGVHQRPLTLRQARFYESLATTSLSEALADLEEGASTADLPRVAEDAMRWLAEGVAFHLWTGTTSAPA